MPTWKSTAAAPTPAKGGPGGWEQSVGCVYYEAPDHVVLIDPLAPPAGTLAPDAGEVKQGARLQIAYFDQQREELDPDRTVADTVIAKPFWK